MFSLDGGVRVVHEWVETLTKNTHQKKSPKTNHRQKNLRIQSCHFIMFFRDRGFQGEVHEWVEKLTKNTHQKKSPKTNHHQKSLRIQSSHFNIFFEIGDSGVAARMG